MNDYCLYCWREAEETLREQHQDDVPCCLYHYIKIASGGGPTRLLEKNSLEMLNRRAERHGYESWEALKQEYQSNAKQIDASKVISIINQNVTPYDDLDKEDMVEMPAEELRQAIRDEVNNQSE